MDRLLVFRFSPGNRELMDSCVEGQPCNPRSEDPVLIISLHYSNTQRDIHTKTSITQVGCHVKLTTNFLFVIPTILMKVRHFTIVIDTIVLCPPHPELVR